MYSLSEILPTLMALIACWILTPSFRFLDWIIHPSFKPAYLTSLYDTSDAPQSQHAPN